jgi:hypothetical protein
MSIIIVCISCIITLNGDEKLPKIFIEQVIQMQKSRNSFKLFDMNSTLQDEYNIFNQKYNETISIGLQAEHSKKPEEIQHYLSAIRELQTTHDRMMEMTKSLIYYRLEHGECKRVKYMNDLDIDVVFSTQNMQNQVISLYRSRCQKIKLDWIEELIKNKKNSKFGTIDNRSLTLPKIKSYKNDIPILLFINSNPVNTQEYDQKIIALFEKYKFKYIIYDVFTSKYALELLKQYSPPNVTYYPTIVIGKRTIHGYGPQAIFDALKEEWFRDRPLDILKTD